MAKRKKRKPDARALNGEVASLRRAYRKAGAEATVTGAGGGLAAPGYISLGYRHLEILLVWKGVEDVDSTPWNNAAKRRHLMYGVWRFGNARGAHYHLLLWGFPQGDGGDREFEEAVSRIWLPTLRRVRSPRCEGARYGQWLFMHDFRDAGFYVALYQGDQSSTAHDQSGRTWGVIRPFLLDLRPKFQWDLSAYQAQYVRRVLRNHRRRWVALRKREGEEYGAFGTLGLFLFRILPVEQAARLRTWSVLWSQWEVESQLNFPFSRATVLKIFRITRKRTGSPVTG